MKNTKKIFIGMVTILSLCFIGMFTIAVYNMLLNSPYNHGNAYQTVLPITVISIIFLLSFIAAYIIGHFVFKDAQKRGLDPWIWTGVSIFIPSFMGLIFYLLVRNKK